MTDLTKKIKAWAREVGFDKVGVARAEDLPVEREQLKNWLAQGFHGEMRWMEKEPEKRTNPQILFPGAKSVVSCALNYFTPHKHEETSKKGKISRYAWGDDYHDVLKEKLRELLNRIKSEVPEADGKICVDTAPFLDKEWAVRAGLGWIGKHTNLITREFGSWVFLGALVLNLELEYETVREANHCGNCTACLEKCPPQAIVAPYRVDSNACISYATIELRADELPPEIEAKSEGWLYGCDICQDVCPWNRFEKPTTEARFEPRFGETSLNLNKVLELTPEKFAARFRRSAIKRTKLRGLQRNARSLQRTPPEESDFNN